MTESTFYVADNLRNGKYIHAKCKISDIETAYWDADVQNEYRKQVFLLRKRDVTSYNFDIVQVKQLLEAYLYSQPIPLIYHQGNSLYGFKAMKNLLSTLKQEYSYGEITYLDQRAFHLLFEHKALMCVRIRYMAENHFIREETLLISEFEKLKSKLLIVRNMALKYNIAPRQKILASIITVLDECIKKEEKLISELLGEIYARCKFDNF